MNRTTAAHVAPILDYIILKQIHRELLKTLNHKGTQPCCLVGWCLFTGAEVKHWMAGQSPPKRAALPCNMQTEIEPYVCLQFSLTSTVCSEIHCKMHSDPQLLLLRISTPECHKLYILKCLCGLIWIIYHVKDQLYYNPRALLAWWATVPFLLILSHFVSAATELICHALYVSWRLQCWHLEWGTGGQDEQTHEKHSGQVMQMWKM